MMMEAMYSTSYVADFKSRAHLNKDNNINIGAGGKCYYISNVKNYMYSCLDKGHPVLSHKLINLNTYGQGFQRHTVHTGIPLKIMLYFRFTAKKQAGIPVWTEKKPAQNTRGLPFITVQKIPIPLETLPMGVHCTVYIQLAFLNRFCFLRNVIGTFDSAWNTQNYRDQSGSSEIFTIVNQVL